MANDIIHRRAEEQVLLLLKMCKLSPKEIIKTYTGEDFNNANFNDAVFTVEQFNRQHSYSL